MTVYYLPLQYTGSVVVVTDVVVLAYCSVGILYGREMQQGLPSSASHLGGTVCIMIYIIYSYETAFLKLELCINMLKTPPFAFNNWNSKTGVTGPNIDISPELFS